MKKILISSIYAFIIILLILVFIYFVNVGAVRKTQSLEINSALIERTTKTNAEDCMFNNVYYNKSFTNVKTQDVYCGMVKVGVKISASYTDGSIDSDIELYSITQSAYLPEYNDNVEFSIMKVLNNKTFTIVEILNNKCIAKNDTENGSNFIIVEKTNDVEYFKGILLALNIR